MLVAVRYAYILLLGAERAWAMAMHMRTVHAADTSRKGIVGSARRHIISRLNKATVYATQLVERLQEPASNTSNINLLEARAYLASLSAAFSMEKHRWEQCLQQSSLARIIYTALEKKLSQEPIRDFLSGTIDPSIRYASHQLKLPRSISLDTIAKQRFPNDPKVRAEVEAINPDCFGAEEAVDTDGVDGASQAAPQTISWRSKTVKIEDAAISQALAAANLAETKLSSWISGAEGQSASWKEQAANYDNVIIASQDAVDATKAAIDDLTSEGVDPGDSRLQSLQVTKTAVNYILVGWRAGRNRVLCGEGDGLGSDPGSSKRSKAKTKANPQEQSIGRRIGGLRERLVLYNGILQSLDSVKELPGVAGDRGFMEGLEARRRYFQSLRFVVLQISLYYSLLTYYKMPCYREIPRPSIKPEKCTCPLLSSPTARTQITTCRFKRVNEHSKTRRLPVANRSTPNRAPASRMAVPRHSRNRKTSVRSQPVRRRDINVDADD